ncbi:MAG: (d)CMP kinase [Nitrospira sp. SB0666_bin_27]|nr:(d)CMP kinase [Nitrospira sp. SB0666_bin_27]MYF24689.1 (d)CMP kinase [Nitrospira sp. SB0678_bin_10]
METFAQRRGFLITIDGPAGAGKSTTARALASRLGYAYLDTGALYRAVAWVVRRAGIDCADVEAMEALLSSMDFHVSLDEGVTRTFIDNEEITGQLRSPEISRLASTVAALPYVRDRLLPIQARLSREGGIVAEGRDTGTRVFPEADVKFFLEADLETRTTRRHRETVRDGHHETQPDIRRAIEERDANDRSRATAPLKPAGDAVVIDSSSLTVEQVVERMLAWIPGHS